MVPDTPCSFQTLYLRWGGSLCLECFSSPGLPGKLVAPQHSGQSLLLIWPTLLRVAAASWTVLGFARTTPCGGQPVCCSLCLLLDSRVPEDSAVQTRVWPMTSTPKVPQNDYISLLCQQSSRKQQFGSFCSPRPRVPTGGLLPSSPSVPGHRRKILLSLKFIIRLFFFSSAHHAQASTRCWEFLR